MAYNNKNLLKKRAAAVRLANEHYEPGRQDKCYKWVWRKHIAPLYHVQYQTFMMWMREERKRTANTDANQLKLFD